MSASERDICMEGIPRSSFFSGGVWGVVEVLLRVAEEVEEEGEEKTTKKSVVTWNLPNYVM